uniref:Isoform b of Glycosyltransferase family 92 protein F49C12.5 n=1 Tax=Caenorhabditis elegans TaxID=6239 RepID=Q20593-2
MRPIHRRPEKVAILVTAVLFAITIIFSVFKNGNLGKNALALVMSINLVKSPNELAQHPNPPELVISAENDTTSIMVKTPYSRVTPHDVCQIITVFATVQLLPNVKSIKMVSGNELTEIPFSKPSSLKRDVVVCTSPLFVSEQWQNFLFAVHIYKKFDAHMNLYLVSSITSFYELMKEYEKEGYMTIQPWVSVKYPEVSKIIADSYDQIEFRNQAAAQTDCLLQFKESARFITFLDLDDVLIPKLAPTYAEEFQKLMVTKKRSSFIFYHKENYNVAATRYGSKFSLKNMFNSMECQNNRETGKIVVNPKHLNFTWIHYPPISPEELAKHEVTENVITHLKTIVWVDEEPDGENQKIIEPLYYDNSTDTILSRQQIKELETDLENMMMKPNIQKIFAQLPDIHYYTDLVVNCYNDRYYKYHYSGRISEITCPGPQLCEYHQHPNITCMRVNATYHSMKTLSPITYYYANDPHFTSEMGCYAH